MEPHEVADRVNERLAERNAAAVGLRRGEAGGPVTTDLPAEVLLRRIWTGLLEPDVIGAIEPRVRAFAEHLGNGLIEALGWKPDPEWDEETRTARLYDFFGTLHSALGQHICVGLLFAEETRPAREVERISLGGVDMDVVEGRRVPAHESFAASHRPAHGGHPGSPAHPDGWA